MCDQITAENINETSETESEEWDVIESKDIQVSGNTSDAESIEIISEEEVAQTIIVGPPSNDNQGTSCSMEGANEISSLGEEISHVQHITSEGNQHDDNILVTDTIGNGTSRNLILDYVPNIDQVNSFYAAKPRDTVLLFLALFVLGLAVLLPHHVVKHSNNPTNSVLNEREVDIAVLINELKMYRESNELLKQQVNSLIEVVNGMRKISFISQVEDGIKNDENYPGNSKNESSGGDRASFGDDSLNSFIELINFYKKLPYLPNSTLFHGMHFNESDNIFNDQSIKHIFSTISNESLQTTLNLFYKIPEHINKLTAVVLEHQKIEPFVTKWGNKLKKFSNSMENEIKKIKMKFIKHILKSMHEFMFSFYKKLCNFSTNKIITVQECETFNFTKNQKKNKKIKDDVMRNLVNEASVAKFWKSPVKNGRKFLKQLKNREEKDQFDMNLRQDEMVKDSGEEAREDINENYEEIIVKSRKLFSQEFKMKPEKKKHVKKLSEQREKLLKILETKANEGRNVKNRNKPENNKVYSEYLSGEKFNIDPCKEGFSLRCNHSGKSESMVNANWFLNIGDQRSKIRFDQSKGDWMFERAKARRERNVKDNYRQFYKTHRSTPFFKKATPKNHWFNNFLPPILFS